ncbi:MAG: hypothetical protein MPK62_12540, partial [Alphaproteobacteria bacterium]|nr:hypothetical protein [Alphaproteobacteria bacterium]
DVYKRQVLPTGVSLHYNTSEPKATADLVADGSRRFGVPVSQTAGETLRHVIAVASGTSTGTLTLTDQTVGYDGASRNTHINVTPKVNVVAAGSLDAPVVPLLLPRISIEKQVVVVEGGAALIRISLSGPAQDVVAGDYTVTTPAVGGAQTADFVFPLTRTWSIARGETSTTIRFVTRDDAPDTEAPEIVLITLRIDTEGDDAETDAVLLPDDAVSTIYIFNDDLPALTIQDEAVTIAEGGDADVRVNLQFATDEDVSGVYTLTSEVGDTAVPADYVIPAEESRVFTIAAGETSGTITLEAAPDAATENDETFTLTIALAEGESGATLAATATTKEITIQNVAPPVVNIAAAAQAVTVEEDVAGGNAEIEVTVDRAQGRDVVIVWETTGAVSYTHL